MPLLPYRPLTGAPLPEQERKADFAAAERIHNVRFGTKCVYLGRLAGLGGHYIRYEDITRWFIHMEAATGGEATFHMFRLVVNYGADGECASSLGEVSADFNEKTPVAQVLALLRQHGEIPLGRDYTRKSRFPLPEE